jgi:plasmid stabilization system protein ParE
MSHRSVRFSRTFLDQFVEHLAWGEAQFGRAAADAVKDRVFYVIETLLARHPAVKRPHPDLGLTAYPVSGTPFLVLYDFDDAELRVHFILHARSDLAGLDPKASEW